MPIIRIFSVVAEVMLIQQLLLHTCLRGVELERMEVHKRNFFQNNGVMNRLVYILAPGERAMAVNEDGGNCRRGFAMERLDDHIASLFFIFACNFLLGHFVHEMTTSKPAHSAASTCKATDLALAKTSASQKRKAF